MRFMVIVKATKKKREASWDPFSKAERGEIVITGGFYCDVAIRFPQLFCFSQANAAGPATGAAA